MDIVFDVDGTLMNIEHRVKYARRNLPELDALNYPVPNPDYDYDKFESEIVNDTPNVEVFAIAHALLAKLTPDEERCHRLIIASGRKERWKETTLDMLNRAMCLMWGCKYEKDGFYSFWSATYFRKDDDNRKDSIVKEEMYRQMLWDGYDPKLVFDDRQQVVDMWRDKGIRVCQVAEGNF